MYHDLSNAVTKITVLSTPIDVLSWEEAIQQIASWASRHESRMVTCCNVHSVVTADQDQNFCKVLEEADMATPDGAPIAWVMRHKGAKDQQRLNGPDLMWRYLHHAEEAKESIFLYGGTPETLEKLAARINKAFPRLQIAGSLSPPFRALSAEEDAANIAEINASGAQTVWVSLGCPKQERWMREHRGKINGVMLGVGAAFNYHAGTLKRAPLWMQQRGLEWLYRLLREPRYLWRRYVYTNTMFIISLFRQRQT
jgi:N-acetylglucosaminyldiphosphoundecaprenol N-acetyl-beta-D-mannosaminyltransferase